MTQTVAVIVIVAAAVVAAIVWFMQSLRGESSCKSCVMANQCELAANGKCPSDHADAHDADPDQSK